ncbi:MAG TPA: ribonuclease E/G [Rhodospirillales bacterium]|nr:ribonuclease E/G [Rhodospirillales bacterium]
MPTKRMLIDASHPEETRVAIVIGNHLENFDVEVESRRQLRGNIYLAKVTRVEPSLQAAFVDYGGNRHGFLAFSEIHPDYYQIPVADREKLLAEQQAVGTEAEAKALDCGGEDSDAAGVETLGGDDSEEVEARRPATLRRRYKIQEVIKRRQILLVQVVKEERGTKGAALTTYLSLAGRYCVLMPNTARGGGISRKISTGTDRRRLKTILGGLGIPKGMAVIVRTAGQKRSKAEIKRDYEYLMRVWSSVRDVTLESMAPCLVHEEGNLIKRSIRDLYDKDIDEIIIEGEAGYRLAKDFMKMLIPSHTKRVQPFKETNKQLFQHFSVEGQLDGMHSPTVQLKSGGYIVINPTEALVSIDVNSGRATRGRNIEETALKTNLEAADEIARQLKLRDLAGLIVIDFIDMEIHRNQVKVERRIKDVMGSDRARIQIGRISPFGLLELSRQRLRPSLIETSSEPCPYCEGTGIRRSTDSAALHLLRALEEEGMQKRSKAINVAIPSSVALYILNNQRPALADLENKYQLAVTLETDDTLIPPDYRIERVDGGKGLGRGEAAGTGGRDAPGEGGRRQRRSRRHRHGEDTAVSVADEAKTAEPPEDAPEEPVAEKAAESSPESDQVAPPTHAKRRRRGRRGGRRRSRKPADRQAQDRTGNAPPPAAAAEAETSDVDNVIPLPGPDAPTAAEAPAENKSARRRKAKDPAKRSGGIKTKKAETEAKTEASAADKDGAGDDVNPATGKPARRPRRSAKTKEAKPTGEKTVINIPIQTADEASPLATVAEPSVPARQAAASTGVDAAKTNVINIGGVAGENQAPGKSQGRKGWWNKPAK